MNIEKVVSDIARLGSEKKFNECILSIANENFQVQKNICHNLFKLFDLEVEKDIINNSFLSILMAIPVELALLHQSNKNSQTSELIDFIASHFLSRSNGTHESLRLAMIVFYSHIECQDTWKRQKILERFGENILNSVFHMYSHEKSKSSVAFHFLSENFESFMSLSPELAAMTNSFLQAYMLRNTVDFMTFITQYKNYLLAKKLDGKSFLIHLSFFIRQSFELEHEELSFYLTKTFIDYVYCFEENFVQNKFHSLAKILFQSKNLKAKNVGFYLQNALKNKNKISCKLLFKSIGLKNESATSSLNFKAKKTEENVSPFQKIFLLCTQQP